MVPMSMLKVKMAELLCKDAPESIGVLLSHGADVDGKDKMARPLCILRRGRIVMSR